MCKSKDDKDLDQCQCDCGCHNTLIDIHDREDKCFDCIINCQYKEDEL